VSRNEWRLKLALVGRTQEDRENAIGFNAKASGRFWTGRTSTSRRGLQGQGYIFFPHPEWKKAATEFASDIRRNWEPLNMFPVRHCAMVRPRQRCNQDRGYENLTGHVRVCEIGNRYQGILMRKAAYYCRRQPKPGTSR